MSPRVLVLPLVGWKRGKEEKLAYVESFPNSPWASLPARVVNILWTLSLCVGGKERQGRKRRNKFHFGDNF